VFAWYGRLGCRRRRFAGRRCQTSRSSSSSCQDSTDGTDTREQRRSWERENITQHVCLCVHVREREIRKNQKCLSFFSFLPGKRFWWMDEMDGWMDQEMRIDQQQLHTRCCRSRNQPVNELPWCNNYFFFVFLLLFPIRRGMNRAPIRLCCAVHMCGLNNKKVHTSKNIHGIHHNSHDL
jgi:hypothetical protein